MTLPVTAFMLGLVVAVTTAAFVIRIFVAVASTTLAIRLVLMATTTLPVCHGDGFKLAALKLGNSVSYAGSRRPIDIDAAVDQVAQGHTIDAATEYGVNWSVFLSTVLMNRNQGVQAAIGIKNEKMFRMREVGLEGRFKAVCFTAGDAEFHGVSSFVKGG